MKPFNLKLIRIFNLKNDSSKLLSWITSLSIFLLPFFVFSQQPKDVALSSNGASTSASSEGSYQGEKAYANRVVDGKMRDPNDPEKDFWGGTGIPSWVEVDLGQTYGLSTIGIWWAQHRQDFEIQLSQNGSNWTTVYQGTSHYNEPCEGQTGYQVRNYKRVNFQTTQAQFIRVRITSSSAPSSHIFQSKIAEIEAYKQTPKDLANSSKGASATASSEGSYQGEKAYANRVVDGKMRDPNDPEKDFWGGTGIPSWVEVDLGQTYDLSTIGIWWDQHRQDFEVQLSQNGSNWSTVYQGTSHYNETCGNQTGYQVRNYKLVNFQTTQAQYIRIRITSTSAPSSHIFQSKISELEAYDNSSTGKEDFAHGNTLKVYPNPTKNNINIKGQIDKVKDMNMEIHNATGQVVYEDQLEDLSGKYQKSISLKEESKGIYFLRLSTEEGQIKRRIILK